MIIEYNQTECYLNMSEESYKTTSDWMNDRSWKKQLIVNFVTLVAMYVILDSISFVTSSHELITSLNEFAVSFTSSTQFAVFTVSQIDFNLKHVLSNDVTMYEAEMFELFLVNNYQNIFRDFDFIVNIFENEWMFVNFKFEVVFKFNKMYFIEVKNRNFIDVTFDKLHQQDKLHWIVQSISFSYSVFVVWRDTFTNQKKRVVIDIKDLNDIIESDNYSLLCSLF